MAKPRRRRRPEESRKLILEAAEQLLIDGGPAAVEMRAVGREVGMTDAGVAHHFGSRHELLVGLLRHGGHRLRDAIETVVATWASGEHDVEELVTGIAAVYRDGYAELAIALHAAGWRDEGEGLLETAVQALHTMRRADGPTQPSLDDTRLAIAALHQGLAIDPVYGPAFRRSAGIRSSEADRPDPQIRWWADTLKRTLELEP